MVKEDLLNALYCEFINRVNEVGVDVNRAIAHPHTQSLVQYVCGLGQRKGAHLLKVRILLKNLTASVSVIHLNTLVVLFCADFKAKQHSSGKQNAAGHNVPHGTQSFYQLCWFHQD